MAQTIYDVVMPPQNISIPSGQNIELINSIDNGLSLFNVTWRTNNGSYSGRLASRSLAFTNEEIAQFNMPIDKDGLPLFQNLKVAYTGPTTEVVSTGEQLVVFSLWYNNAQIECVKLQNQIPNTDGHVGIQCNQLRRA